LVDIHAMRTGPGFTLIELVMVLVIIAVTSAVAIPRFAGATQDYRASMAAQRLVADLAMVQSRANLTSTTLTVTFSAGTGKYTVPGVPDLRTGAAPFSTDLGDSPFNTTFASITLGGVTRTNGPITLSYTGLGIPSAGGTLTLSARSVSLVVTVDGASGKATTP
jgi:prepilin-type N-terminal cleavage/methylation domain-containing protein